MCVIKKQKKTRVCAWSQQGVSGWKSSWKVLLKAWLNLGDRQGFRKLKKAMRWTVEWVNIQYLRELGIVSHEKRVWDCFFNGKWNKISCRCADLIQIYQQNTRYIIILYVNMLYFTQNANFWNKQLFQRMKVKFLLQTLYIDPFDIKH